MKSESTAPETIHSGLDSDSPVPLYFQLRQSLERDWRRRFGADDDLPIEQEIMDEYGVSRVTVRRALDEMIGAGLIHRPRARGRLRWAPTRVKQQLNRLRGFFSDDALASGQRPSTQVLEITRGQWPLVAQLLRLGAGDEAFRISRLHLGDDRPLSYQLSYVPCALCPDLAAQDLSRSLLALLENKYRQKVGHVEQRLRCREATAQEAKLLRLAPHGHVFEVDRVTYNRKGLPVEYFEAVLDAAQYEFLSLLDASHSDAKLATSSPWASR